MTVLDPELKAVLEQLANEKDPDVREQLLHRAKGRSIANAINEINQAQKAGKVIVRRVIPSRRDD